MVAPLYNCDMWLVSQKRFKKLCSYLVSCVFINPYGSTCTSKHIIYDVSHLISVKNILSRFWPSLVTGAIIVIGTSEMGALRDR